MNLALFDFDGTLTRGDSFVPFLHYASHPLRRAVGGALLSPLLVAYRLGWVPARLGRPLACAVAFAGRRAAAVRELGERYAREVLPATLLPHALERLAWHRARGDRIAVVSASLDAYIEPWCREQGVDAICTALEQRGGWLSGRYRGGDCSGESKAARIRERYDLARYPLIYAYGDTEEDRPMLALAQHRYYGWRELPPEPGAAPADPSR